MNKALLDQAVQEFIEKNYQRDAGEIVLKGSPFPLVSAQELATQLTGKKKAVKKLSKWFHTRRILYPPVLNLEQTSSDATAHYKASLVSGTDLADLTGGFGVDAYYFSQRMDQVYHLEKDDSLSRLAAHNLKLLGASNISFIRGDSIKFLREHPGQFDWIYVDPSRRSELGGRVFRLEDCVPNVVEELDLMLSRSRNVLIKTAPLLDIQAGLRELSQVREIHVVAADNEVKELLWVLGNPTEQIQVTAVNITGEIVEKFKAPLEQRPETALGYPSRYLYEPNAAIMKSGLFGSLAEQYQLKKLHPNSHLFTSSELIDFPGRRFVITEQLPFKRKKIKKALGGTKANITTRNFPFDVASLRKELKIRDGGDSYLFFTSLWQEERVVLVCQKV